MPFDECNLTLWRSLGRAGSPAPAPVIHDMSLHSRHARDPRSRTRPNARVSLSAFRSAGILPSASVSPPPDFPV